MGSQLSSSQQSPGLSSLGSNGQQSRHGRSPPPNSASQNSLALCSSSASSSAGGRHSAALIRGRSLLHSSPPSSCASSSAGALFQSRFLVSPPMFRRRHEHQLNARKSAASGAGSGLSRWGSFTRALPSLVRGNSGGGAKHNGHGHLLAKEQQKRRQMMTTGNGRVPKYEADPNNNDPYSHHQNLAFYEQGRPKTLWSDEEEEAEDDEVEESPGRPHRDFSLKASLKKSGSRLFNGILRGGYLRAFLSDEADDGEADEEEEAEDDENNEEEGEEKVRENERKEAEENQRLEKEEKEGRREEENRRKLGRRETASIASDLLNNNGPACLRQGTACHFSSSSSSAAAAACRLRPTNSFFQHQSHKGPTSAINTSTLRSSLRQAKRHLLMPGGGHPPNGGLGGNGLVSSMLLAMAAGQPPPVARPFSCPEPPQTLLTPLDWNGNCERNSALPQLQRKKVIQASSSELIRALGHFIYQHCRPDLLSQFEPAQLSSWLRGVDRALILQGWQDIAFINPANLVFLFMLIRDAFARGENQRLGSLRELHSFVLLCLYISYSYMGNEISYPLKPFITENTNRALFWSQCVRLIKAHSGQMLRLNSSSTFFLETFTEMKDYFPQLSSAYYP